MIIYNAKPEVLSVPSLLGLKGEAFQAVELFPKLETPKPARLVNRDIIPSAILDDHDGYQQSIPVMAYALRNHVNWGNGFLFGRSSLFFQEDCFPSYYKEFLCDVDAKLPKAWMGARQTVGSEVIRVPGRVFSVLHPNLVYGHFLLEILPRLYLAKLLTWYGVAAPILLSHAAPPWVIAYVRILFAEDQILWFDHRTQGVEAESFIVPGMMHTTYNFHPAVNLMVAEFIGRVIGDKVIAGFGSRRIFLSRKMWGAEPRLTNQDEIEETCQRLGLTIVHPEYLSVEEQITLMANTNLLVGEFGSALHNAIFMPVGSKVVSINFFNSYQSAIARTRDQTIAYVPPDDGNFRHWNINKGLPRVYGVNCKALKDAIASVENPVS
jgi:capsular polysaccharide biosynthesis protein